MDCSPPGSPVPGILQARILEWVAMPSSRRSFLPRDQSYVFYVFCIGRWALYLCYLGSPKLFTVFHCYSLEKEMATHSSSCLESLRDGGAWWATIYGVAQSWTRLKRLSSSSSMRRREKSDKYANMQVEPFKYYWYWYW